jgi:hypothetical protein
VLAEAFLADGLGFRLVPQALGTGVLIVGLLELLVEPAAAVGAGDALEFALDFPVVARDEGADAASRSTMMASVGVCTRPTGVL